MKIRTGFVSNSSSSSFILIGWEDKTIEDYDYEKEYDYTYYDEEGLVGISLPDADDYSVENVSLDKLQATIQKAQVLKEQLGFKEEPKLIYGIRSS